MRNRLVTLFLAPLYFMLFTSGCIKFAPPATTLSFPETKKVDITFQNDTIPTDCRVFSHRLTFTPAGGTGRQIHDSLITNARAVGADMVLIGLVREQLDEDLEEYQFHIYGPSAPYLFQSRWNGWKFGFNDWRNQGDVINFGINALQDDNTEYRQGLIIQNIYLTCRPLQQVDGK